MKPVMVRMEWEGEGDWEGREVAVAGEFNGWIPVPLVKQVSSSLWVADVPIEPGCYGYKFLVDGEWVTRAGDEPEDDGQGGTQGLLIVEEEDDMEEVKENQPKNDEVSRLEDDLDVLTLGIDKKTAEEMLTTENIVETPNKLKEESKHDEENTVPQVKEESKNVLTVKIAQENVDEKSKAEIISGVQNPKVDAKLKETTNEQDENTNPGTDNVGNLPQKSPPVVRRTTRRSILVNAAEATTPTVTPTRKSTRRSVLPSTPVMATTPTTKTTRKPKADSTEQTEAPVRSTRTTRATKN